MAFVYRSGGVVADLGFTSPPKNAKYAEMRERETLDRITKNIRFLIALNG